MGEIWRQSVDAFAKETERHYGPQLRGIFLYGSRARRDHDADSDADVAVVLSDDAFDFWRDKEAIGDIAYRRLLADGLYIHALPFSLAQWTSQRATGFVASIRDEAQPVFPAS